MAANLLEEKEDLSRIHSVRSKDGYFSAAPIRTAITSQAVSTWEGFSKTTVSKKCER